MFPLARTAGAVATALALLLAPAVGRAELTQSKLRYVLLDASFESAVTGGDETLLFYEDIALKKPGCVLVRYSGELVGTDADASGHVAADFKVYVNDDELGPYPSTHESTTSILPQIVSFSAFRCGVPAGPVAVAVTFRPQDEDDVVATTFRTIEVWAEKPFLTPVPIPGVTLADTRLAGTKPTLPNLLRAKRAFLSSSEDAVTAHIDPVTVFEESITLNSKPSCLLVRFSADVLGENFTDFDSVQVTFQVRIGTETPTHPGLVELTDSEQPQIVTFSAFRCGLEPGTYEVAVVADSASDNTPVHIRARVFEIFTETGQPAPLVE